MMNREDKFLEELTKLSKKYGIYVTGCGCCNSPELTTDEMGNTDGNLYYCSIKKEYQYYGELNIDDGE